MLVMNVRISKKSLKFTVFALLLTQLLSQTVFVYASKSKVVVRLLTVVAGAAGVDCVINEHPVSAQILDRAKVSAGKLVATVAQKVEAARRELVGASSTRVESGQNGDANSKSVGDAQEQDDSEKPTGPSDY